MRPGRTPTSQSHTQNSALTHLVLQLEERVEISGHGSDFCVPLGLHHELGHELGVFKTARLQVEVADGHRVRDHVFVIHHLDGWLLQNYSSTHHNAPNP